MRGGCCDATRGSRTSASAGRAQSQGAGGFRAQGERAFTNLKRALAAGGNSSSVHGFGRRAHGLIEDSREQVATALGVRAENVVFTSGGVGPTHDDVTIEGVARALDVPLERLRVELAWERDGARAQYNGAWTACLLPREKGVALRELRRPLPEAAPVPAATSSTRPDALAASRLTRSTAYGSNSSGTRYVS